MRIAPALQDDRDRAEGDEISGRKLLMWNNDVEISLVRPSESMDYFFRNGLKATRSTSSTRHRHAATRRPAVQGGRLRRHSARDDLRSSRRARSATCSSRRPG